MKKSNLAELRKAYTGLSVAYSILEDVTSEERDAFDNHSERWQESEKGEQEGQWLDTLEELRDAVEESMNTLDDWFSEHDIDLHA